MPKYTLIHGGLKVEGGFKSQGDEVELSTEEAAKLNEKHPTVVLSDALQAEADAKAKAAAAVKAAEEKALQAEADAKAKKAAKP